MARRAATWSGMCSNTLNATAALWRAGSSVRRRSPRRASATGPGSRRGREPAAAARRSGSSSASVAVKPSTRVEPIPGRSRQCPSRSRSGRRPGAAGRGRPASAGSAARRTSPPARPTAGASHRSPCATPYTLSECHAVPSTAPRQAVPLEYTVKLSILMPVYNEQALDRQRGQAGARCAVPVRDRAGRRRRRQPRRHRRRARGPGRPPASTCICTRATRARARPSGPRSRQATGDYMVILDADLEYDPQDIPRLLEPVLDGRADVVYGSRTLRQPQRLLVLVRHGQQGRHHAGQHDLQLVHLGPGDLLQAHAAGRCTAR